jgi:3-oxoacyl-[acyl-carrier protein] reductase
MSIITGLENKVVVVTGGAAGIGRATARRFAEEGAQVSVWDIAPAADAHAHYAHVNVANREQVESAVAAVVEKFGRVDVLVNNAGIVRDQQLIKCKDGAVVGTMTDEAWDAVIDINLKGVFHCTRALAPHMIRQKSGVVLNASSVVGLYGNFGQTNYTASKAGVIAMTKTWARELGRYGIRVNAVAPGFIATEILRDMPQKIIDGMVGHTPLGRMGKPEDIADAYLWLASDAASFITGITLSVDGGIVVGT